MPRSSNLKFNKTAEKLISNAGNTRAENFLGAIVPYLDAIAQSDAILRELFPDAPSLVEIAVPATKKKFRAGESRSRDEDFRSRIEGKSQEFAVFEFQKEIRYWWRQWGFAFTSKGVNQEQISGFIAALNAAEIRNYGEVVHFELDKHTEPIRSSKMLVEKNSKKQTSKEASKANVTDSLESNLSDGVGSYLAALILANETIQLPLPEVKRPTIEQLSLDIPLLMTSYVELEGKNLQSRLYHTDPHGVSSTSSKKVLPNPGFMIAEGQRREWAEIQVDLDLALKDRGRILILGDPGSGKSTKLQLAACKMAHKAQAGKLGTLPALLKCRLFHDRSLPESLSEAIAIALEDFVAKDRLLTVAREVEVRWNSEGGILFIDAIDEIHPSQRRDFCRAVTKWARINEGLAIVATSRSIGIQEYQDILAEQFETCRVGPLSTDLKTEFVQKFQRWKGITTYPDSLSKVAESQSPIGRLTDTVLMLALATQVLSEDPNKEFRNRIALLDRAIEKFIARKADLIEPPVLFEELVPFLDWLALTMRRKSQIRFFASEAIEAFDELRRIDSDLDLKSRPTEELVELAIQPIGILAVAGTTYDNQGNLTREIQFLHQIFQEHLAARACCFKRGNANSHELIQNRMGKIDIQRQTLARNSVDFLDPILTTDWHETIRMTIGRLPQAILEEVFQAILPCPNDDAATNRARAVFAVSCLADGPNVSSSLLRRIIQEFCDVLLLHDDWSGTEESFALRAIRTACSSDLRPRIIDELIFQFQRACSGRSILIGSCLIQVLPRDPLTVDNFDSQVKTLKESIGSSSSSSQILGLIRFLVARYEAYGQSIEIYESQTREIISILLTQCHSAGSVRLAALWALIWAAKVRDLDLGSLLPEVWFDADQLNLLESIVLEESASNAEVVCAAHFISAGQTPFPDPNIDFIYELALIADGDRPRRSFPELVERKKSAVTETILRRVERGQVGVGERKSFIRVMASMGIFSHSAIPLVWEYLIEEWNGALAPSEEAILILGAIGTVDALNVLIDFAKLKSAKDDLFQTRILLGVILADNVEQTAELLAEGNYFPEELALCLAGSRKRQRGLEHLRELAHHSNQDVRRAVAAAIQRSERWEE